MLLGRQGLSGGWEGRLALGLGGGGGAGDGGLRGAAGHVPDVRELGLQPHVRHHALRVHMPGAHPLAHSAHQPEAVKQAPP